MCSLIKIQNFEIEPGSICNKEVAACTAHLIDNGTDLNNYFPVYFSHLYLYEDNTCQFPFVLNFSMSVLPTPTKYFRQARPKNSAAEDKVLLFGEHSRFYCMQ
jgi:hypothetical protein